MTSKTTRTTTTTEIDAAPGQLAAADLARQQLAAMADGASAVLHASEVFGQVRQQAMQRAALMHQQTAEKLRSISSPAELLTIQSGLMMSSLQESTQFWQELTAATMKLQAEMVGRVSQPQSPGTNVAGAAMSPMLQAWQNLFTAPQNAVAASATTH